MRTIFTLRTMFIISSFMIFCAFINAQTTLNPGDIMVVTVNADGDDTFDFVPLIDIEKGTVIKFTDNGYNGTALRDNEGVISYTATKTVKAGAIVSFTADFTNDNWTKESGNLNFAAKGDNLLAYQDNSDGTLAFLYGIGWASNTPWISSGNVTNNNSYIPAELSEQDNTIVTLGTSDNYQYDMAKGDSGSQEELLGLVGDAENWIGNNSTVYSSQSQNFSITPLAIQTYIQSKIKVYTTDSYLVVENAPSGQSIEVYNTLGQKIAEKTAVKGHNQIALTEKGLLIVRVGKYTTKVVMK